MLVVHSGLFNIMETSEVDLINNIKKLVEKKGRFGSKPGEQSVCECVIDVLSTTEVTSDYLARPTAPITIGYGTSMVDQLIETCLESMYVEEESIFDIPVYSDHVNLRISLLSGSFRPHIYKWTCEDKVTIAKAYKCQGIELYAQGNIIAAFTKFSKSIKLILLCDKIKLTEDSNDLLIQLYNNLAMCQFQQKNYLHVVTLCSESLNISPNVKALYRRAVAYTQLTNYECAIMDLQSLLKLEPSNKAAISKLNAVNNFNKSNKENYEATIKKMFQ